MDKSQQEYLDNIDPDPLVLDFLVSLAATAFAGGCKKVAQAALRWHRERGIEENPVAQNQIGVLRRSFSELERLVDQASEIIKPASKLELGGILLLNSDQIAEYHKLRDAVFDQVRQMDQLSESMSWDEADQRSEGGAPRVWFPKEFRSQLKRVEKCLRSARSATLAGEAFLDVKKAILNLRGILEFIERDRDK